MARHDIDKATVRNRLEPRREPYWGAPVERGLYVGYRSLEQGGNWVARYRNDEGRQVYQALGPATAGNDYEAAKKEARRWCRALEAGVRTERLLTVADVCRDYTAAIEAEGRKRTAIDARKRFDRIVYDDPIGKLRADKLTQRHLEAWMARMEAGEMTGRKKGLPSKATFNRNLSSLKAALNRAVSRREIPHERAIEWKAIKPHRNADGRREVYLDRNQRRALLEAATGDLRDLLTCIALTGCRPGDPAAMLRKDWDGRTGSATFGTKTGSRTIPVSPAAKALFNRLAKSKLPAALMFTNAGKPWTPQTWAPLVKAAAERARLPADTVAYSLRHAWISDAIVGGMDPVTVARLNRHVAGDDFADLRPSCAGRRPREAGEAGVRVMAKAPAPLTIPEAYREAVREAQRETDEALAADPNRSNTDPTLPIFQFVAMNDLVAERARFEAGDKNALLASVRICANHDLVMPEWLARAFIRGYDKVLRREVASWDDAFGRPLPKGKHSNAAKKKREKAPAVWLEVRRLHEAGRAIDDLLFEDVGKKLGLGKTLVAEFYYEQDARWAFPSPAAQVILEPYRRADPPALPEKRKTLRKETRKP